MNDPESYVSLTDNDPKAKIARQIEVLLAENARRYSLGRALWIKLLRGDLQRLLKGDPT